MPPRPLLRLCHTSPFPRAGRSHCSRGLGWPVPAGPPPRGGAGKWATFVSLLSGILRQDGTAEPQDLKRLGRVCALWGLTPGDSCTSRICRPGLCGSLGCAGISNCGALLETPPNIPFDPGQAECGVKRRRWEDGPGDPDPSGSWRSLGSRPLAESQSSREGPAADRPGAAF